MDPSCHGSLIVYQCAPCQSGWSLRTDTPGHGLLIEYQCAPQPAWVAPSQRLRRLI